MNKNISDMLDFYNEQANNAKIDKNYKIKLTTIKWSRELIKQAEKGINIEFGNKFIHPAIYRPFCKVNMYSDKRLIDRSYTMGKLFPTNESENLVICMAGIGQVVNFHLLLQIYCQI